MGQIGVFFVLLRRNLLILVNLVLLRSKMIKDLYFLCFFSQNVSDFGYSSFLEDKICQILVIQVI